MIDLKQLAHDSMRQAQANLRKDGHLLPVAMVIQPKKTDIIGLQFDAAEKHKVYERIADLAKRTHALAVVTINDARLSRMDAVIAGLPRDEQLEFATSRLSDLQQSASLSP
jgi:hypothetical protein